MSKNMDVKINILQVEVGRLQPNPWNTNAVGLQNFEKLKGSIDRLGFFKPILARELSDGSFQILGGEHRWRAAIEQGIATVPVITVGQISDVVAMLPNRQIVKNSCQWRYRSAECGYTGPYFDKNDAPTKLASADYCTKRLSSCRARINYFANGIIAFGGFPGANRA